MNLSGRIAAVAGTDGTEDKYPFVIFADGNHLGFHWKPEPGKVHMSYVYADGTIEHYYDAVIPEGTAMATFTELPTEEAMVAWLKEQGCIGAENPGVLFTVFGAHRTREELLASIFARHNKAIDALPAEKIDAITERLESNADEDKAGFMAWLLKEVPYPAYCAVNNGFFGNITIGHQVTVDVPTAWSAPLSALANKATDAAVSG